MPIVDMKDMVKHAYENRYAIGSFNIVNLDSLIAIIEGAEKSHSPVILSLDSSHFNPAYFALLLSAVEHAAKGAAVPVAIDYQQSQSVESAVEAIRHGCNGVMVNAFDGPLQERMKLTQEIVAMAHSCGISVEGDFGYRLGGQHKDTALSLRTGGSITIESVKAYVEESQVDFLSISIGDVDGFHLQNLNNLHQQLNRPLSAHIKTRLNDDLFDIFIQNGVAKINYHLLAPLNAADAITQELEHAIYLSGSSGRAQEVLLYAQPWKPIEHLIIYNTEGIDPIGTRDMAMKGRTILSKIPGVRSVFIGESIQEDARYRYTWCVRFCHPSVINSYRDHPEHIAFANTLFRPVAGNRITIDYQEIH